MTAIDLAEFFDVTERTVRRSVNEAPKWARRMLLYRCGNLGALFPEWKDWEIRSEYLIDPGGNLISPAFIYRSQVGGDLVLRAEIDRNKPQHQEEVAKAQVVYLSECIAGWLVAQHRPSVDKDFVVTTTSPRCAFKLERFGK